MVEVIFILIMPKIEDGLAVFGISIAYVQVLLIEAAIPNLYGIFVCSVEGLADIITIIVVGNVTTV